MTILDRKARKIAERASRVRPIINILWRGHKKVG